MTTAMNGKTCLITGATAGIGKETALGLAKLGAHVVIVGRDRARTQTTCEWLMSESANHQVEFLLADCSSQREVRRLADEVKQKYQELHVLINNAGAIFNERQLTVDGYEHTWALNHLAYVLLTHELLGLMQNSGAARIINVASVAHRSAILDFDNLQGEKSYGGFGFPSYRLSKLANIMFSYALARRLQGSGVTVNCLHPGVVATQFAQNNNGFLKFAVTALRPFFLSASEGAQTSIYLASSEQLEGVGGLYFAKCKPIRSSKLSYNIDKQERLWAVAMQQLGIAL